MTLRIRTTLVALVCISAFASQAFAQKSIVLALPADGLSAEERMPLQNYLTKEMGREVKVRILNNYNEYVAGLGDGSVDFALLGAVNYVRARAKHGVIPLVNRTYDLEAHAVFITSANSSIKSLQDLKGKEVAFGDMYSASGHAIPAVELKKAGINPQSDIKFRYTGGHPNTAKLVETGVVDAGALDEGIYKSMIDQGKLDRSKVRVFHTSKPFVDWVFVGRKELPESERTRFTKALESLTQGRDDQVLRIIRAKQCVAANDNEYGPIRQVARELNLMD
jgi:phosphonate transport system substrate-binding protein